MLNQETIYCSQDEQNKNNYLQFDKKVKRVTYMINKINNKTYI